MTCPRRALPLLLVVLATFTVTRADEPPGLVGRWTGSLDFFATGQITADDTDADGRVDALAQPASLDVTAADVPTAAIVVRAYLYWAGTVDQPSSGCAGEAVDDVVTFTAPGGAPTPVVADVCRCSDGGSASFDVQACRADVTGLISDPTGTYVLDDFVSRTTNGSSDNGSFAVVLVYRDGTVKHRTVEIQDGLQSVQSGSLTVELAGLDVDDAPVGKLTYYVLEGDPGGAGESVTTSGEPGGGSVTHGDAVNPVNDPMNRTINTQIPPLTGAVGVDVDTFDISGALSTGDGLARTRYDAGTDRWWWVFQVTSADERHRWTGSFDHFATGEATVIDTGGDGRVDTLAQPASVMVSSFDVPAAAVLERAFLYWAGTIDQVTTECAGEAIDDVVTFTPPGGVAGTVTADSCRCDAGGDSSYDIQACRADVTASVTDMIGTYTLSDFSSRATNASADNGSFSIVLVYRDGSLSRRVVELDDRLRLNQNSSITLELTGLEVDDAPSGRLTWYTLEGDVGGAGIEGVETSGHPGGSTYGHTDAVNPANDPMNRTINTQSPQVTDSVGVDIDAFDISSALTAGDSSLETRYDAGTDKHWLAWQVASIEVAELASCEPGASVDGAIDCSSDLPDSTAGSSALLTDYPCGTPTAGLEQGNVERVYAFASQTSGDVTFRLTGMTIDHDLYVLLDPCDPSSCLAGSSVRSATSDEVTVSTFGGETYYLVVEAWGGPGSYELSIDDSSPGCSEDCDDGIDNDLDGDTDCDDGECGGDAPCCLDADGDGWCAGRDCDDGRPLCGEDCVDADMDGACVGSDCDDGEAGSFVPPHVVTGVLLEKIVGGVRISWDDQAPDAGSATVYDVVSGNLGDLRVSGEFSGSSCKSDNLTAAFLDDPAPDPPPGAGEYILVRGQNDCPGGTGTFGSASRDSGSGASSSACD